MADASEWFRFAQEDLEASQRDVFDGTTPRIACFNAQQAVEKLLKGVLIQHGIDFRRLTISRR